MGEAKMKRRLQKWAKARETRSPRTWAKGQIIVTANGVECFNWTGTHAEAVALQRRYLDQLNASPIPARAFAEQAIFSMVVHGGPPEVGQDDMTSDDVETLRNAMLWLVLREHIPNTGFRVEDALADLVLEARFTGDRDRIQRARRGEAVGFVEWELQVIPRDDYLLDPREAVIISGVDLFAIVDPGQIVLGDPPPNYVPRIPLDADEGREMLQKIAYCEAANPTGPDDTFRFYLGYSDKELAREGLGLQVLDRIVWIKDGTPPPAGSVPVRTVIEQTEE